ncbi:MAG TPA: metal ABC transporter permease [Micromonosporaceae bacterium]|nr:metal ABC transporter permease [Micromonosporaceae bacterium]
MDFWQFEFMRRALVAAVLVGLAAPAVGIFLVQRRLALIGDGLGHVAVTGVALGLVLDRAPVGVALLTATAGAVLLELIRVRGHTSGDIALAVLFYGGIAAGVVLVSRAPAGVRNLDAYLFGSITTTSWSDVALFAVLTAVVLLVTTVLGRALFSVSNDEEFARATGLPVVPLNLLLAVLTAFTVVIAMRVIGVLLVSALMVVPVATAQQLTRGFRATMLAAMAVGLCAAGAGVWLAGQAGTAPGATIVVLAIAAFAVTALGAGVWRAVRRRTATPLPAAAGEPPDVIL